MVACGLAVWLCWWAMGCLLVGLVFALVLVGCGLVVGFVGCLPVCGLVAGSVGCLPVCGLAVPLCWWAVGKCAPPPLVSFGNGTFWGDYRGACYNLSIDLYPGA